ncbi:MAG: hypothetical protein JSW53_02745 [Candidatus Bathyarchaeota archaeon]|nr:MAG: hypothetical protein JSW53_02745 [Candidatus Bathyarchaeota archaeon]
MSIILVFVLTGMLIPAAASDEILVGVKAGDQMEYDVYYYGAGSSPPSPYLIWYEVRVLSVQGTTMTFDLRRRFSDGVLETDTLTEDLEMGVYELFIIPANLSAGDVFSHEGYGFVTINGVEEKTYAGVRRTVVKANVANISFIWDRNAGVLVDLLLFNEIFEAYMNVELIGTNIWQAQFSLPIDPIFYVIVILVMVMVVVVVFFAINRSRKRTGRKKKRVGRRKK